MMRDGQSWSSAILMHHDEALVLRDLGDVGLAPSSR